MASDMHEYLVDKARQQIWCNPLQDNQYKWKPERITPVSGTQGVGSVLGRDVNLPWPTARAHLFQIGAISPALLGLLELNPSWVKETWINVADTMNVLPLYMNIYNESGVNIPRSEVYYMYTREKCLIFAVREDRRLKVDLGRDNIYFRMYTSAFLRSNNPPVTLPVVQVATYEVTQFSQINSIRNAYLASKTRRGHTEAFVNGYLVSDLTVATVDTGDIVEWIYEASVKRMVTWKVNTLKNFISTLDDRFKLILHYPKDQAGDTIDFSDDLDLYIQYRDPQGNTQGYYYLCNQPDALRNLTHCDYSVVGDYVDYISKALAASLNMPAADILEFEIVAKIREGGYNRKLVKEAHRIFELYKLSDTRIVMAMSGVDDLVPVWNAASLESSAYTELMRLPYNSVDIAVTEEAYGYNSISQILADTPQKTYMIGSLPLVDLPYELAMQCTAYEYDSLGRMLGYYTHSGDDNYKARDPSCRLVEALVGIGDSRTSVTFGRSNLALPENADWRLYVTEMDDSRPGVWLGGWKDITDDTTKYRIEEGRIIWSGPSGSQYLMLRTNEKFLAYTINIPQTDGLLLFNLSEFLTINGVTDMRPMPVPMGDLQLTLNGYNLVQGIDYVVNFPTVCINAQKYYRQGTTPDQLLTQNIHVRFTGFCDADLKMWKPRNTGFVINGVLSENNRYDIFDDKVMHISVGGAVMAKQDVKFFEDHPDFNPRSPVNGQPYQIKDIIVPLRDFTLSGTYPLLKKARVIDRMVSSYMELYWPKPTNVPQTSATERWRLTSPFMATLVDLCVKNRLTWAATKIFSDQEVIEICKPYESLLKFDPIGEGNTLPDAFVNITPTRYNQSVNVQRVQYRFLDAAARIYSEGRVKLNNFITFSV